MNKKIKVFFDAEFTGFHQDATLISIGFVTEEYGGKSKMFYAEFTDYNRYQVRKVLRDTVINNLFLCDHLRENSYMDYDNGNLDDLRCVYGDKRYIKDQLDIFFKGFGNVSVQLWSDFLSYGFVLFNGLWGSALHTPKNISRVPLDLCTLFEINGIDVYTDRREFIKDMSDKSDIDIFIEDNKFPTNHNALINSIIIRDCYNKIDFKNSIRITKWEKIKQCLDTISS